MRDWHPSDQKKNVILNELLAYGPLFYSELRARCKGQLSNQCLTKALIDLERAKQVIREPYGRKRVEYQLNPENPFIRPMLKWAKNLEMVDETIFGSQETLAQDSLKALKAARDKRTIVTGLVFQHATVLAATFVTAVFASLKDEDYAKHPLVKRLILENLLKRVYTIHKQVIVELHKLDARVADEALQQWQDELESMVEGLLKRLRSRSHD